MTADEIESQLGMLLQHKDDLSNTEMLLVMSLMASLASTRAEERIANALERMLNVGLPIEDVYRSNRP